MIIWATGGGSAAVMMDESAELEERGFDGPHRRWPPAPGSNDAAGAIGGSGREYLAIAIRLGAAIGGSYCGVSLSRSVRHGHGKLASLLPVD